MFCSVRDFALLFQQKPVQKTLGFFKMKNGDEGDIPSGSLFANRGKLTETTKPAPPPLTGINAY